VAVQQRDPLGKLVLLGSPGSYTFFVGTKKMSAANMHRQLAEVYGDNALSMHCQGNKLPYGATGLHLTGPN
jgi:hypothetical protein